MALFKDPDRPEISEISPVAAIPGGEFEIRGKNFARGDRPRVLLGDVLAPIVIGSNSFVIARVPEEASQGEVVITSGAGTSAAWHCDIGVQIATDVHPVSNPAVDRAGNIYTTLSGPRGQKTQVSVFKLDTSHNLRPLVTDVMNATGLALDSEGVLYVSSRYDGIIYQVTPGGNLAVYVEGMGVATGIAFDPDENLYVGDRSGTIFKISRQRQIYVFAALEPSIAAYHLAFGADGNLYVTGPTTSSFDCVYRITPQGEVSPFFRGLGRPQGIAAGADGNLYIAASLAGRKGVVKIDPSANASLFLSGPNIVGLALAPPGNIIVATNSGLFRVNAGVRGLLPR
ncbi:MAG: gluconolaconase [Bryobacteraceae bacterium]|nr:gluconolaconase [Bryobacteraceae bacterium]